MILDIFIPYGFIVLWFISGYVSAIFILGKAYKEITLEDLFFALIMSVGGIATLIIGYLVFFTKDMNKIVIWRKKDEE